MKQPLKKAVKLETFPDFTQFKFVLKLQERSWSYKKNQSIELEKDRDELEGRTFFCRENQGKKINETMWRNNAK